MLYKEAQLRQFSPVGDPKVLLLIFLLEVFGRLWTRFSLQKNLILIEIIVSNVSNLGISRRLKCIWNGIRTRWPSARIHLLKITGWAFCRLQFRRSRRFPFTWNIGSARIKKMMVKITFPVPPLLLCTSFGSVNDWYRRKQSHNLWQQYQAKRQRRI